MKDSSEGTDETARYRAVAAQQPFQSVTTKNQIEVFASITADVKESGLYRCSDVGLVLHWMMVSR